MDGEVRPGASGVTEAPSAAEAYTAPRGVIEVLTPLKQKWETEFPKAKTPEQQFDLIVSMGKDYGQFLDANPTNQMQAEEYEKQEVNAAKEPFDYIRKTIVAVHAQKSAEQHGTDDEIKAAGGMSLDEPSAGSNVVDQPPVDTAAISRDTQTEPGVVSEAQSSTVDAIGREQNEPKETYGLGALNRTQLAAVKAESRRRRRVEAPVRARAPFRDEAIPSMSTNNTAAGESIGTREQPKVTTSLDTEKIPSYTADNTSLEAQGRTLAEQVPNKTPLNEKPLVKLSGEPINMSTDSSGQWKDEPINMSTDNSKIDKDASASTSPFNPAALENTTAWDGSSPKATPEEHLAKLSGEPINMSTDSSGRWKNEPINMSTDNSKAGKDSELGKLSESPQVAAQAEKLGGRVKEKLKENKGKIARAVAVGMLAFIGFHDDAKTPTAEAAPVAPPSISEIVHTGEEVNAASAMSAPESSGQPAVDSVKAAEAVSPAVSSGEIPEASFADLKKQVQEVGKNLEIPEGGSVSGMLEQSTDPELHMSRTDFNERIFTQPELLVGEYLANWDLMRQNWASVPEQEMADTIKKALEGDQQALADVQKWYSFEKPGQQVLFIPLDKLPRMSEQLIAAFQRGEFMNAGTTEQAAAETETASIETAGITPADGGITPADSGVAAEGSNNTTPPPSSDSEQKSPDNRSFFQKLFGGGRNNATNS